MYISILAEIIIVYCSLMTYVLITIMPHTHFELKGMEDEYN